MIVKLLTEHHFEFLSLKGVYTGLSECTLVKIPHCWKSHPLALIFSMCYAIQVPSPPIPFSKQNIASLMLAIFHTCINTYSVCAYLFKALSNETKSMFRS